MTNVRSVMNPNVRCARAHVSVADVAMIMEKNRCGAVPIVDGRRRVVGMVTDRDICLAVGRRALPAVLIAAGEVMSKKVYACSPDQELAEALETMQNNGVRRLPVIDATGRLGGILSMDDVVLRADTGTKNGSPSAYELAIETLKAIYTKRGAGKPPRSQTVSAAAVCS